MLVELLCFDGCSNGEVAHKRLTEALRTLHRDDIEVQRRQIETAEQAEELTFLGSPTIRVDGTDPIASETEQVGPLCRVYATPAGLSGSPTSAQLPPVLR